MKKLLILLLFLGCDPQGTGPSLNIKIPGVQGPTVYLKESNFLISMVLEKLNLDGGLRYEIPNYSNSYVELSPDFKSKGTMLSFNISVHDLLDGHGEMQPLAQLPGGRNLPGIPSGQLPATAFSITDSEGNSYLDNTVFYLGNALFGVFLPLDFGSNFTIPGGMITSRFYVAGQRAGTVTLVGSDQDGKNSGVLFMLDLNKAQKHLKKIAKKYPLKK